MLEIAIMRQSRDAEDTGVYSYEVHVNQQLLARGTVSGHPRSFPWTHLVHLITRDWDLKNRIAPEDES